MRLSDWPIVRKLFAGFGTILLVMLGVSGVTWSSLSVLDQANGWNAHTYAVLALMEEVNGAMLSQETGVRGLLVSGESSFLQSYHQGRDTFATALMRVRALTRDNSTQQARLNDLEQQSRGWQELAEREIALVGQGRLDEARALAAAGEGTERMDRFRAKLTEIRETESALLITRQAEAASAARAARISVVGGLVAGLALALGIIGLLIRTISTPIGAMTAAMARLANGDTTSPIPATERGDEVGAMARAVQVFRDNRIQAEHLRAAQESDRVARERRASRIETETQQFDTVVGGLLTTVSTSATRMQGTASAMSGSAEDCSRQAAAVASAAEQISANVQTVASAAEELSASIGEISRQVSQSSRIAGTAVDRARQTNETVNGLAVAAARIGEVVTLITDIASQTNLLALNATIEAARAGEAGKGFAVVAGEVKILANQTAKATEEIGQQIAGIQQETAEAVQAIKGIAAIIADINEIGIVVAAAVEEQGAAAQEIARNVQQAALGTAQVTTNIAGVQRATELAGQASGEVLGAAETLSHEAERLQGAVQTFLGEVRAA